MYEMVKPERSVHYRVRESEQELAMPEDDRILDAMLYGADTVRRELAVEPQPVGEGAAGQAVPEAANDGARATEESAEDIVINILDSGPAESEVDIKLTAEAERAEYGELEASYAEKLDNIALKTNRIFGLIIEDLFSDDQLLPRLRRLFWLEATKAERDFTNHIVKPMLRQHDRKLFDPELRKEMEVDLESVSDVEELMRVWEGLHSMEDSLAL
jgi:hypothetical protein